MLKTDFLAKLVATIAIVPILSLLGMKYLESWTGNENSSAIMTGLSFEDKNSLGEWWTTSEHPNGKRAYFYAEFRSFAVVLDQAQKFEIEAHCSRGKGNLPVLYLGITKDPRFSRLHKRAQFDEVDHFNLLSFEVTDLPTYQVEAYFTQNGKLAMVILDDVPALYSAMIDPKVKAMRVSLKGQQLGDFHLVGAREALQWVHSLRSC